MSDRLFDSLSTLGEILNQPLIMLLIIFLGISWCVSYIWRHHKRESEAYALTPVEEKLKHTKQRVYDHMQHTARGQFKYPQEPIQLNDEGQPLNEEILFSFIYESVVQKPYASTPINEIWEDINDYAGHYTIFSCDAYYKEATFKFRISMNMKGKVDPAKTKMIRQHDTSEEGRTFA